MFRGPPQAHTVGAPIPPVAAVPRRQHQDAPLVLVVVDPKDVPGVGLQPVHEPIQLRGITSRGVPGDAVVGAGAWHVNVREYNVVFAIEAQLQGTCNHQTADISESDMDQMRPTGPASDASMTCRRLPHEAQSDCRHSQPHEMTPSAL